MNTDTYSSSNSSKSTSPTDLPISNYTIYQDELKLNNRGQLGLLMAFRERGIPLRTAVCGFSMQPFIRDRDVLTIEPMMKCLPLVGEVVAFIHPFSEKLVIHRVIAKNNSQLLLKGDNSTQADGLVKSDQILGKVVRLEREHKQLNRIFLTGAGGFIIAFLSLRNLIIPLIKMISMPKVTVRKLHKVFTYIRQN